MYKLIFILLLTSCSSLSIKVGASFNDERSGEPEITGLVAPLGIIRAEYETERDNTVFCEHLSSLSEAEQGSGLNHCGFLFRL